MAQFKIYGRRRVLVPMRLAMSDLVHGCAVDVLGLQPDKRFRGTR